MNLKTAMDHFWSMNEIHSFNSTEIALYMYLIRINDLCSWKESFKHNNSKIIAGIKVTFKTLANARNKLKQAGMIDFVTKNGASETLYSLTFGNFTEARDEVSTEVKDEVYSKVSPRFGKGKVYTNCINNSSINKYIVKGQEKEKFLFVSIKNLNDYLQNFKGNKSHFILAYRFWKLWIEENPKASHLLKADVYQWVNTMKLIIVNDQNGVERMLAILEHFKRCQAKQLGFNDFWFTTISSLKAFRKTGKDDVKQIDKIAKEVNQTAEKQPEFHLAIETAIKKFKQYESSCTPSKQV
ncbi:hypothetical protein CLU97_0816 [Chryseobacterium sp. 7]|uniref:hypothetical protein n=1 Tax=Chryseobacterium sp. 7 TaxID=2035214 RepID=UPI000EB51FCF|nr:hypothetical protein [Chryseobacterium sp. 7]RLJ31398.1 hypothetical protein CLU97_0816 [Chryseobacterium sp. 7]